MELRVLRLVVEAGPRKGETLERCPGSVARIGRVLRGNHVALRDPGASQKHLLFEFLREASRWAVSDLDTSNGTLVNGNGPIPPSVPFPLSHGDVIKIGKSTIISVHIVGELAEVGERRELGAAGVLRQEDEGEVIGKKEVRRRGQRRAVPSLPPLPPPLADSLVVAEDTGSSAALAPASRNARRGRGRPIKENVLELEATEESVVEKAKGRGRGRPSTRSASEKFTKQEDEVVGDALNSIQFSDMQPGAAPSKGRARGGRRPATRSSAAKASTDEQDLVEKPLASTAVPGSDAGSKVDNGGRVQEDAAVVEKEMGIGMDRMTLGEWFDKMEKILPLMISDASEQIIANLQEKSRLFEECSSHGT